MKVIMEKYWKENKRNLTYCVDCLLDNIGKLGEHIPLHQLILLEDGEEGDKYR